MNLQEFSSTYDTEWKQIVLADSLRSPHPYDGECVCDECSYVRELDESASGHDNPHSECECVRCKAERTKGVNHDSL